MRTPSISALGVASRDELHVIGHYPSEGNWAPILRTDIATGGTTGNLATAAAKLGANVAFVGKMGSDPAGNAVLTDLESAGVDCSRVERIDAPTDLSVVLVSADTGERTILWRIGPYLVRGDHIDIDALFGTDLTVLDCPDLPLRRFLTDLPAHTRPAARLMGTLTYLAAVPNADKLAIALRHDVLVGNEREYQQLTGASSGRAGLEIVQAAMVGSNLRQAYMTMGSLGAIAAERNSWWERSALTVDVVDTTGAGDAFAGAIAYATSVRMAPERALQFAVTTASFVVSGLGAQAPQPCRDDVLDRMQWTE
ncbi:MAG TPA: carbohydrate kinase family protein [Thermomicrobiales bacterium]|nr:carbohydrate kinase family protein [Thermomicrobiales bacterium]